MDEFKTFNNAILCDHEDQKSSSDHDTVGAVAIDQFGNNAAATSTGGITGKQPGRVGDTPVIGSGAYADNLLGAVSTTGKPLNLSYSNSNEIPCLQAMERQ